MARLKRLRGTRWDVFGRTEERRTERALIGQYEDDVAELLDTLSFLRHPLAVKIARWPESVRGFGHVKAAHLRRAAAERDTLLAQWRQPASATAASREAA